MTESQPHLNVSTAPPGGNQVSGLPGSLKQEDPGTENLSQEGSSSVHGGVWVKEGSEGKGWDESVHLYFT